MTVTSDQLTKSIKGILKDGDLDQLSAKKIRKMLEAEYKTDFTDRKEEIDKLVMKLITENDEEEKKVEANSKSSKATNGKSQAAKRPATTATENKASDKIDNIASNSENDDGNHDGTGDDDDSDLGEIEDTDVVPKKKAKVQSSGKKLNDEELAKKLQEDEDLRPSRRCKAQPAAKRPRKQSKEKTKAKGTSVYSRPCELLPPLNKVLESERMPRPMIVKRLWEIVKERNLLDPKNKQFMLCDEEMQGLFGKKKIRMFGMMKLLKPYIKDLPKE